MVASLEQSPPRLSLFRDLSNGRRAVWSLLSPGSLPGEMVTAFILGVVWKSLWVGLCGGFLGLVSFIVKVTVIYFLK